MSQNDPKSATRHTQPPKTGSPSSEVGIPKTEEGIPNPPKRVTPSLMPLTLQEIAKKSGQTVDDAFLMVIGGLVDSEQPYIKIYPDDPERNFTVAYEDIKAAYDLHLKAGA